MRVRPRTYYRRRPYRRRSRRTPLLILLIGALALAAVHEWRRSDSLTRVRLHAATSGLAARTLAATGAFGGDAERLARAPLCNCSSDLPYTCEDPRLPYFERVRTDVRLAPLFDLPPHRRETYATYANFLRDQFPHGIYTHEWRKWSSRLDLLEMLDEADRGATFQCRDISVMLSQLVQAAGGFARLVSLGSAHGEIHVVVEAWLEPEQKWAVFDPDYNVHATGADGVPLSALEIHELARVGLDGEIEFHPGTSPNTLYLPERRRQLLDTYETLMFGTRASAVTDGFAPWHPARHSSTTGYVWRSERQVLPALYYREVVDDADRLYFTPCRPGAPAPPRTEHASRS